jgi:hypothetical protein
LGCCWNHCTIVVVTSLSDLNLQLLCAFLKGLTYRNGTVTHLGCMEYGPVPSNVCSAVCPGQCGPDVDRCHSTWWYPLWTCQDTFPWWQYKSLRISDSTALCWLIILGTKNWMIAHWSCLYSLCTWNAGI